MNDVWHIHGAPMWLFIAFLFGRIGGLMDTSREENIMTVAMAIPPDATTQTFTRLLTPKSFDEPIRTEDVVFRVDHEKHTMTYP